MLFKKLFCALLLTIVGALSAMAQSQQTTTHVVDRGETLASIASAYGVSQDQIIALNPEAAQFVYVGMELTIPVRTAPQQNSYPNTPTAPSQNNPDNNPTPYNTEDEDDGYGRPFDSFGLCYITSFDQIDVGTIGISWSTYNKDSGFGANFGVGWLTDFKDLNSCQFFLGPSYAYGINKINVGVDLDFVGNVSFGKDENGKDKTFFDWGIMGTPKIAFKVGNVIPSIGIPVQWVHDTSKLHVGLFIGLGFNF